MKRMVSSHIGNVVRFSRPCRFESGRYREPWYTVDMKESILKLRDQGYTYNQITAELGCSKGTVAYHCGPGQQAKTLQRQRDKRNKVRRYLQSLKEEKSCADCGVNYPYFVMDFDHLPEYEKSFDIATFSKHHTMEDVMVEVTKCDVVCANCHRMRTWSRLLTTGHSTLGGTNIGGVELS